MNRMADMFQLQWLNFCQWLKTKLLTPQDDRGDINGYVFVTLMTAGIVMVIWVIAREKLTEVFNAAISSVLHK